MVVANRHALPYRGDYDPDRQLVFTRKLSPPAMPSLVVLPLVVHERSLGTLVLGSKRKGTFGDAVRPTLEVLASSRHSHTPAATPDPKQQAPSDHRT